MIPTRRLSVCLALALFAGGVDFVLRLLDVGPRLGVAVLVLLGGLALVAAADLALAWRRVPLRVARELPQNLSQAAWHDVTLHLTNDDTKALHGELFDGVPPTFTFRHQPCAVVLPPGGQLRVTYPVRPEARGDASFSPLQLRRASPLGLWQRLQAIEVHTHARVFPDFSWLSGTLALVGEQRMQRAGVRLSPRRGEGMEFHQLREYRTGDSQRQIDWKATARRALLISREYQEERDQQILMVLDTGSRMRAADGGLSHFDQVLRAMLLLSFVALRQGDSVGLLSFGGQPRWLAMQRGARAVNRLLDAVYDLESGPSASDYIGVAQEIRRRQQRRALVVLLTNAREEDEDLLPALDLLRGRHIAIVTSLREAAIDAADRSPVRGLDDALRYAAASSALLARQRVRDRVHHGGNILLDCAPAALPVRLVHDYWQLKRSGRL